MSKNIKVRLFKSLKIALNALFYLFIVFLLVFSIANMRAKSQSDIPSIFGVGFLSVISNSMEGEEPDSFNKGDLIFVSILDDKSRADLQAGDIITFWDDNLKALNTHRIVQITDSHLITQGDKVAMDPVRKYDPSKNDNDPTAYEIITKERAIAVHTSTWSNAGITLARISSPGGFALFIILPAAIVLGLQGFFLVKNILVINKAKLEEKYEKDKEESKKELEAQKDLIRAQLLEEMKKEKDNNN